MAKYQVIADFKNEAISVKKGDIIDAENYKGEKFLNASIGGHKYLLPKAILQEHSAMSADGINKKMPMWANILPFVGIAGGISYAIWKKKSPWGVIGYSVLGASIFAMPIFFWYKKDMTDAMVGKPLDKNNAVHKLYILLSEMQKEKNKTDKTTDTMVGESTFNKEIEKQKFTDSELMFLYDFNKGMFDLLGAPKEQFGNYYDALSKKLAGMYDASIINSAQTKFNNLNILPKGTI